MLEIHVLAFPLGAEGGGACCRFATGLSTSIGPKTSPKFRLAGLTPFLSPQLSIFLSNSLADLPYAAIIGLVNLQQPFKGPAHNVPLFPDRSAPCLS